MPRLVIGIDPGKKGALAWKIDGEVRTSPMADLLDFSLAMRSFTQVFDPQEIHVYVEKAQSRPGQGVSSMFSYGAHFGSLLGVLTAYGIPHTLIPPQTWTKTMHVGTAAGDPKQRSLEAARRLFPSVALVAPRGTKPHSGLIDALLIMEYGCRALRGAKDK